MGLLNKIEAKLGNKSAQEKEAEKAAVTGSTSGTNTTHTGGNFGTTADTSAGSTVTGSTGPHSSLENPAAVPTAGGHKVGGVGEGHHHGHHLQHPARDAAVAGGVAGVGAHEYNKHHHGGHHGHHTGAAVGSDAGQTRHGLQHPGRDAALAGGVGAAGVGAYEHEQNRANRGQTTTGPHNSDMLNKLDPRVESDPARAHHHHHHTGRDAALAGGVGAAGVGAYEHEQNRANRGQTTTGPHNSNTLNKLDPRVESDPARAHHHHHAGRDAALAGGVGAAGVGAYEHEQNRANRGQTTTGPHNSNMLNKLDPRVESDSARGHHNHHTGRDAALAGGAGAGGMGAYDDRERNRHYAGETTTSSGPTTTGPHSSDLMNKLDPRVDSNAGAGQAHHGLQHPGRDAAVAGGVAGVGLHEHNKHHGRHEYEHGQQDAATGTTGPTQAKKMGGAYEAGYRDAMEHVQAERR